MTGLDKKHLGIISLLYLLAFGLMLLNPYYYWDDWIIIGVNPIEVKDVFVQNGTPFAWIGHFHNLVRSFENSILVYRLTTFLCYLFSGIFLSSILKRTPYFSYAERLALMMMFLLLPLNHARIAIINTPYALTYLAFYLAFSMVSWWKSRSTIQSILIILLFMFSFTTGSMLFFFYFTVAPFIILRHLEFDLYKSFFPRNLIDPIKKNIGLLLSPLIYFVLKAFFYRPYGLYEGYNQIKLSQVAYTVIKLPKTIAAVTGLSYWGLAAASILLTSILIIFFRRYGKTNLKALITLTAGFFLIWAALFPYLLMNLIPAHTNWDSRHQLLLPLGSAIFVLGFYQIIELVVGLKFKTSFWAVLTTVFIVAGLLKQMEYGRDGLSQELMMAAFKNSETIQRNTTFIIHNKLKSMANKRTLSFYEYTGMFRKVFNEQRRWGSNPVEFKYIQNKNFLIEKYNLADFVALSSEIKILIKEKNKIPLWNPFADNSKYYGTPKKFIQLKIM